MMKFPSIKIILDHLISVIKRFPFEVLFALTGVIAGIVNVELSDINSKGESWCLRIMMTANLGLLISLATTLYIESKGIKNTQFLFKLIIAIFAASLIFILNPALERADYIRFALLSFGSHLLVSFAAFTRPGYIQGFWQFNKTLFLRFLTSFLYSVALYAGIAAAVGAMNFLFNFNFEWDTFFIIWIIIAGLFNTLFFLAGVPEDLLTLDQDFSYPKGLQVFTQYVLIPLATLYVAILLAYESKIIIEWSLPKGLVSNLILGYSVFGLLSLLLVYPIREMAENKWIKSYARSFYFLMLPLIVLLFVAVGTRIFKYGITEMRYFLILLALWQLFIAVYFLVSKRQNIKIIPISLFIITIFSIYGPQSAFSVSVYSQRSILKKIFKRNDLIKEGKLIPLGKHKMSKDEGNDAVDKLDYLVTNYDLISLQPLIKIDLSKVSDSLSHLKSEFSLELINKYELSSKKVKWVIDYLGLTDFSGYRFRNQGTNSASINTQQFYGISTLQNGVIKVSDFDYIIEHGAIGKDSNNYVIDGLRISDTTTDENICTIKINDEAVTFNLTALMTDLLKNKNQLKPYVSKKTGMDYILPPKMLSFTKQSKHYLITLRINQIRFETSDNKKVIKINYAPANYLIKVIK